MVRLKNLISDYMVEYLGYPKNTIGHRFFSGEPEHFEKIYFHCCVYLYTCHPSLNRISKTIIFAFVNLVKQAFCMYENICSTCKELKTHLKCSFLPILAVHCVSRTLWRWAIMLHVSFIQSFNDIRVKKTWELTASIHSMQINKTIKC